VVGATPLVSAVIRFDYGEAVPLTEPILVGRSPAPRNGAPWSERLVAVDDRAVSKTHLAVTPRNGEVWVEDLHSTNGTSLVHASGTIEALAPGTPTRVNEGTSVVFGERRLEVVSSTR
jgi:hypothetical protein